MRRASVVAAAGAAVLLLASPGLAGTLGDAASRAIAPTGAHVDCSQADVAGCQQWLTRFRGDEAEEHRLADADLALGGSILLLAGSWQPSYYANTDAAVRAVDPDTGEVQWSFTWDAPEHENDEVEELFVSPDGSTAYLAGSSYGDPYVHALDAGTGKRLWTQVLDHAPPNDVAFAEESGWIGFVGDAYSRRDGTLVSKPFVFGLSVEDPTTTWGRTLPLHNASVTWGSGTGIDATGASFVVASATAPTWDRVDALDPSNGVIQANVSIHRPAAYGYPDVEVSPDGTLAAMPRAKEGTENATLVDLEDQEPVWTRPVPETPPSESYATRPDAPVAWSPSGDEVAFGGYRYVTEDAGRTSYPASNQGGLVVYEASTGDEVWDRYPADGGGFRDLAWTDDGAIVAAGNLPSDYAGGPGGVTAYDADDGERRWAYQQQDDAVEGTYRALAVDGDRIYAGGWGEVDYWDPWEVVGIDRSADLDTPSPGSS